MEVAEPVEALSEERTEPTQAAVENSVLQAFIDRPPRRASLFASQPEVAFYPEFFEHRLPCMYVFELTLKKN